jgi:hypothetical protein
MRHVPRTHPERSRPLPGAQRAQVSQLPLMRRFKDQSSQDMELDQMLEGKRLFSEQVTTGAPRS